MGIVTPREEIDKKYKWKLSSIYSEEEGCEIDFQDVVDRLDELRKYQGETTKDSDTLFSVLQLREEIFRQTDKLFAYARMRSDEDTREQKYQAMTSRAQGIYSKARSIASFIEPEIQSLERDELSELIKGNGKLGEYRHYFDDIMRLKPHTRSAEVESLIADFSEVLSAPGDIYNYLTNADLEFPAVVDEDGAEIEITLSNFVNLLKRQDRDLRKDVYCNFFDTFNNLSNTISVAYNNSLKTDVKLSNARRYDSSREHSLDQNNIPVKVYDTLLEEINDNLNLLHRHLELKRKSLSLSKLKMWDVYVPMVNTDGPEIEYKKAVDYVLEAIAPLGEDYQSRVKKGLDSRWVDVYESPGKRTGAYSWGAYDTQPFVLLNYKNDISSLYTLAHELGHSMHSQLTSNNQPYHYSEYSIFVAEVASTLHEALLTEHLLQEVEDKNFRKHVLDNFLETFRSTFFRQAMFAEFELKAHHLVEEGEGVTAQRLNKVFGELKERYYEPAEVDERIRWEWMRIPHFYRSYYVYQYSTGISVSLALAKKILEQGESMRNRYLELLKSGASKYPLQLFKEAGIDMTTREPIENTLSLYDKYLGEMERLLEVNL